MVLRHTLLQPNVTEYRSLNLVVSTHTHFLSHLPVDTILTLSIPTPFFRKLFSRAIKMIMHLTHNYRKSEIKAP